MSFFILPVVLPKCFLHILMPLFTVFRFSPQALVSLLLPFEQLQDAIRILEGRIDKVAQLSHCSVLEPAEVLKLFDGTNSKEDLLPGGVLIQGWLPITPQKSNLEILFEKQITWMYSQAGDKSCDAIGYESSQVVEAGIACQSAFRPPSGFLSLGTPAYPVPYADATYRFDIDTFGNDPASVKMHVVEQLKLCMQSLPDGRSVICNIYAEESLRSALNQLRQGLTPIHLATDQMVLEMDI